MFPQHYEIIIINFLTIFPSSIFLLNIDSLVSL